jgi:hypothetical protein
MATAFAVDPSCPHVPRASGSETPTRTTANVPGPPRASSQIALRAICQCALRRYPPPPNPDPSAVRRSDTRLGLPARRPNHGPRRRSMESSPLDDRRVSTPHNASQTRTVADWTAASPPAVLAGWRRGFACPRAQLGPRAGLGTPTERSLSACTQCGAAWPRVMGWGSSRSTRRDRASARLSVAGRPSPGRSRQGLRGLCSSPNMSRSPMQSEQRPSRPEPKVGGTPSDVTAMSYGMSPRCHHGWSEGVSGAGPPSATRWYANGPRRRKSSVVTPR